MQNIQNTSQFYLSEIKENVFIRNLWLMPIGIVSLCLFSLWGVLQSFLGINYSVWEFLPKTPFNNFLFDIFGNFGLIVLYQVIFPSLCLIMLTKILNKYLDRLWSVAISLLAIFVFIGHPFRLFLNKLFLNGELIKSGAEVMPAIFGQKSLTFLCFILLFYFSVNYFKFPSKRLSVLTILWAFYAKLSPIDSLFGLTFWFPYFIIRLFRQNRDKERAEIYKEILMQAFNAFVILYLIFSMRIYENVYIPVKMNAYYYTAYFIIPLLLTFCAYFFQRIDKYELFFKFWHVYMLMIFEIILVILYGIFPFKIPFNPLDGYSSLFFLHFYYWVVPLYYITKPYKEFTTGSESTKFMEGIRKYTYLIFSKYSFIYLYIIIFLLIVFAVFSAINNYTVSIS